ncbi:MAG: hypothetical protein RR250_01310 [Akkermansia sp.]
MAAVDPLPSNFSIEGYRIVSVIEITEWSILYQAISQDGESVQIREFCPNAFCHRDSQTQQIQFTSSDSDAINALKAQYDDMFSSDARAELHALGTAFLVLGEQSATPLIAGATRKRQNTARKLTPGVATIGGKLNRPLGGSPILGKPLLIKKKSSSSIGIAPFLIVGFLLLVAFLGYQIMKPPPPLPDIVKITAPPPVKPKPKPKPVEVVTVEPEPEPEPEPVEIVAVEPEPQAPDYSPTDKLLALKKLLADGFKASNGHISSSQLANYIKYSEQYVREYITLRKGKLSPAFEEWLKKTKHNYEAFATFYPPDPSIATNIDILVNALGERAYTYDQMVLAFAIGRRHIGMGSVDLLHQGRFGDMEGIWQGMKAEGVWEDPCDLFIQGKPPINYYGIMPDRVLDSQYIAVRDYLKANNLTPKQAWLQKDKAIAKLSSEGVTKDNITGLLREHLYRTKQLKRKRDPYPTAEDFINYLVDKYEDIGKMKDVDRKRVEWDGVPLDCTPWQIMLPLSETRPIREAESVWDRYLGKKGEPRLWRYGPYRMDKDPEPPALFSMDPDPEWSPQSYDRHLHVGGVCGTMSLIERESRIALGSPGGPAGQPGHGNLIAFFYKGGIASMEVGHSVAPLKDTTTYWYLRDAKTQRCGYGEYQLGIALANNISDKSQQSSRLAMNILKFADDEKIITDESRKNTLEYILKLNPFYTEAWYMFYADLGASLKTAMQTIDTIHKYIGTGTQLWARKPAHKNMGRPDRNYKDGLERQTKDYTTTLSAALVELALKQPLPEINTLQWKKIFDWMQSESKDNPYPDIEEAKQIAIAKSKGPDSIIKAVDIDFAKLISFYSRTSSRKKELKVDLIALALQIKAVMPVMQEKKKLPWIKKLVETCPSKVKFKEKDNNILLTDLYICITDEYKKICSSEESSKLAEDLEKGKKEFEEELEAEKEKADKKKKRGR